MPKKKKEKKETKKREIKKKSPRTSKEPSVAKAMKGEPTTMEELLALETEKIRGLKRGEIIEGIVAEITPKSIFIDIGAKSDGVVLGKEFERAKDFVKNLKVGDKLKAYVGSVESENGQILLSLRQAASDFAWGNYQELLKSEETTEVRGREVNKGGLIVDALYSLQGFVPGSQIGSAWQGKIDQLVGRKIEVKVIEVNREQNRLVFSEKLVSDAEKIEKIAKAIEKLKLDDSFEAEVTQVAPFGLFVKIKLDKEEVEGLVHISEVSWQKVEDLAKLYKPKDKVKVKVISLEDGRVQFSIKQLLTDPWDELEKKYPVESKLKGEVTRLTSFGALVEIESGIEGLVHISKIPPELTINEGDKLDIYIESIDMENRRISLGLVLSQKPIGYK
ncbi:MAG TPA: S1 RNA-binding domain-containing protein [Clostridia bacterium]|nr:S1 RNA-binding domain-containing protein [Clostridia bacterium]